MIVSWQGRRLGWLGFFLCVVLSFWLGQHRVVAEERVAVPDFSNYVVDTTQTLTPAQLATLNDRLGQLEQSQGSQIVVLMVSTVGTESIESYARRVYDTWQIGRARVHDGVLLLIAKDDRRMRIEVGYGLEAAITDVRSAGIIRQDLRPAFQAEQYYEGIEAAVYSLMSLVQGEELPGLEVTGERGNDQGASWLEMLPFVVFLGIFAIVWPTYMAPIVGGAFVLSITGSVLWALLAAIYSLSTNLIARAIAGSEVVREASSRTATRGRRRPSDWDDFFGGFGGFGGGSGGGFGGFGGGGGGFGGGGGGSSGGGGASGGW